MSAPSRSEEYKVDDKTGMYRAGLADLGVFFPRKPKSPLQKSHDYPSLTEVLRRSTIPKPLRACTGVLGLIQNPTKYPPLLLSPKIRRQCCKRPWNPQVHAHTRISASSSLYSSDLKCPWQSAGLPKIKGLNSFFPPVNVIVGGGGMVMVLVPLTLSNITRVTTRQFVPSSGLLRASQAEKDELATQLNAGAAT